VRLLFACGHPQSSPVGLLANVFEFLFVRIEVELAFPPSLELLPGRTELFHSPARSPRLDAHSFLLTEGQELGGIQCSAPLAIFSIPKLESPRGHVIGTACADLADLPAEQAIARALEAPATYQRIHDLARPDTILRRKPVRSRRHEGVRFENGFEVLCLEVRRHDGGLLKVDRPIIGYPTPA
jgi:hypothetical protein